MNIENYKTKTFSSTVLSFWINLKSSWMIIPFLLFSVTVGFGQVLSESFNGTGIPSGWTQEQITGTNNWATVAVNGNSTITPHSGAKMAEFRNTTNGATTKLITPSMDLSTFTTAELTFYFANVQWLGDIDELRIYYKTSAAGSWVQLGSDYITEHTTWQKVVLTLPNLSADYYVAFEATSNYARGLDLDDVTINGFVACTGTPIAGTVSDISVCSGSNFTLTSVGASVPAINLTRTWESSSDNVTFTPIVGSESDSYTIVGGVATTMYYRYILNCNSTAADTSDVITVTLKPFNQCYCTPVATNASNFIKDFITTGGTNNISNLNSGNSTNGYGDFTATQKVSQVRTQVVNFSSVYAGTTFGTKIWVDWNQNGVFDASEIVYQSFAYSASVTGSFTVPNTAVLGNTHMRIGISSTPNTGPANPCAITGVNGEFEDYTFEVLPLPECSGQPTAGTVTTPLAVCSGINFNLTTLGSTLPTNNLNGIWQSSPAAANTWTNIMGATDSSYTVVGGVSIATDYRYILNCANNSLADTSGILSVTLKTASECYCTPSGNSASYFIKDFSTTGGTKNITKLGSGFSTGGYGDFTATDTIAQLRTNTVNFSSAYSGTNTFGTKIWVDWNQDGLFDATEIVYASTGYTNTVSSSFTVPNSATAGYTRMRVGIHFSSSTGPANSCVTGISGEFEDYTFNVIPLPECSGQPTAGSVTTPMAVCSSIDFNLSTSGGTIPSNNLNGIWQSSPAGANTWTDIVGATTASYSVVGGVTSATDYRYILNCANSSLADTSGILSVTLKAANECYCTPASANSNYYINNFSTTGGAVNISNLNSGYSTGGYADLTATDTVSQSVTQSINFSSVNSTFDTFGTKIWVDWNQDGMFDATEIVYQSTGYGASESGTITVPNTALLGATRMRIGISYLTSSGPSNPCSPSSDGEYEDYIFKVLPFTPCSGTPTAGMVSDISVCSGNDFTLSAIGATPSAAGLTRTWEESSDNVTFTPIASSGNDTYTVVGGTATTMYYRYILNCNNTDADTSTVVTVTLKAANQCYCTPIYSTGCSDDDMIDDFSIIGENSTSISDLATGCSGGYDDRTSLAAVDLMQGNSYTAVVKTNTSGDHCAIWIDFNDNGIFESTESVGTLVTMPTSGNSNVPVNILPTAQLGNHRMRVMVAYGGTVTNYDPCNAGGISWGETHDYMVNILCGALPLVNLGIDTAYCVGTSITLDAGNMGDTYLWNDNSSSQTLSVNTAGTYSVTVTNPIGCSHSDTIVITENTLPVVDLGADTSYCIGSSLSLDAGNVGSTYLWNDNSANQTLSVNTAGTYSVTVKDANGCISSDAVIVSENALPIVDLGVDTAYCTGSSITLDAGNVGNTYLWSDNSTNQTLSVNVAGNYSVTVTNANGCSATDAVVVSEKTAPIVNLGLDTAYCVGTSFNLTLDAGNVGDTYLWSDNSASQTLSVNTAGTYSVTVTNANNCSTSDAIVITENVLPVVDLGADTAYCAGSSITLDAGNVGSTYLWNDNSASQTLSVNAVGNYSVSVKDANGCISSDAVIVSENALPVVDLGVDTAYCAGSSITLDAGNIGNSYLWSDNSTNQTLSVNAVGTYSVTVTNANGCSATDAVIVSEKTAPIVNLGLDTAYCVGTPFNLTLDAGNVGDTYLWNDNSASQTISVDTAGIYSVTVTSANNCSTTDVITITENSLPVVSLGVDATYCAGSSLTLDAGNAGSTYVWNDNSANQTLNITAAGTYDVTVKDVNGCLASDTIVLTAGALITAGNLSSSATGNCGFDFGVASVANVDSYAWDFGDGATDVTTTAFTSHTFVNEATYTVKVTLSNECGSETKQIDVTCDKTGVNDVSSEKLLTLYPNPTSANITIENAGNLNMELITIIDNLGKVVYQATPSNSLSYQLNVSHLSNGLYTAMIKTDKGVITKKFEVLK